MATIDWESCWKSALKNNKLFPSKVVRNKTISVSCPTRFSKIGKFSIEITPSFNEESLSLEILSFNDNISFDDIKNKVNSKLNSRDFNTLASVLMEHELSNRIMERFDIESEGFESDKEAINSIVDYINNKATESGRMFDDKLDEFNDILDSKSERLIRSIRENRRFILSKVESILTNHYNWKKPKNEDLNDSTTSLFDKNGNLAAVVSVVDNYIIVDLAKDITAKVSMLQSDEEIEDELVSDVDNAEAILAEREIDNLKEVISTNDALENVEEDLEDDIEDDENGLEDDDELFESLSRRLTKLESLFINRRLRRFK